MESACVCDPSQLSTDTPSHKTPCVVASCKLLLVTSAGVTLGPATKSATRNPCVLRVLDRAPTRRG